MHFNTPLTITTIPGTSRTNTVTMVTSINTSPPVIPTSADVMMVTTVIHNSSESSMPIETITETIVPSMSKLETSSGMTSLSSKSAIVNTPSNTQSSSSAIFDSIATNSKTSKPVTLVNSIILSTTASLIGE